MLTALLVNRVVCNLYICSLLSLYDPRDGKKQPLITMKISGKIDSFW
jgi:hypothetical protein